VLVELADRLAEVDENLKEQYAAIDDEDAGDE
jgi:hypothetical protein